jgi:hypothetical protein
VEIPEADTFADVLANSVDGFVDSYIAIYTFIDEDGERQCYYDTPEGMEPWEVLGLLRYAELAITNPIHVDDEWSP